MRQAGVIAAAGVVALETMVDRLADDHERARRLADALAERFPGSVDPDTVETNIVCARAGALPRELARRRSRSAGVLAGTIDVDTVRFVTHKDVDDADLDRAVAALDDARRHAGDLTATLGAVAASDEVPASALAVYAHPDDAEISAGGTLAKWAAAGAEVWVLVTTRGDKGTDDPDADLDALAALRVEETAQGGGAARPRRAPPPRLRRRRAPRRPRAARRDRRASCASCGPRSCCAPTRPRCSSATATSTTATTASPAGRRSTRSRPRPATRTTSPSTSREGLDGPPGPRGVPRRARSSRTRWVDIGDTLERKIDALFCHASQLVDAGDWFREFLRDRAEEAGAGRRHALRRAASAASRSAR